jgi:hypothetical protein
MKSQQAENPKLKVEILFTFMGTQKCTLYDYINIRINNGCFQEALHSSKQRNRRESYDS